MEMSRQRYAISLILVSLVATVLRLGTWSSVFTTGGITLDGTDGYYHLRRAWLTLQDWPWVPQFDHLMNVPEGAPLVWAPLYDFLLATLAKVLPGGAESAVELASAILPPTLGVLQILILRCCSDGLLDAGQPFSARRWQRCFPEWCASPS